MLSSDVSDDFGTYIETTINRSNGRGPYAREIYNLSVDYRTKKGVMEFNGYCYIQPEEFPIDRVLSVCERMYDYTAKKLRHYLHMRITSKEELEDTSEFGDDPEEGMICLCPTNRIRLHFDVQPMPVVPAELERIPMVGTFALDGSGSGLPTIASMPPLIRTHSDNHGGVEDGTVIELE